MGYTKKMKRKLLKTGGTSQVSLNQKEILTKMLNTETFTFMNELLSKFVSIIKKMPYFSFKEEIYDKKVKKNVVFGYYEKEKSFLKMMFEINIRELDKLSQDFKKLDQTNGYNTFFNDYKNELEHCNDSINKLELYIDRLKSHIMENAKKKKMKWWFSHMPEFKIPGPVVPLTGDGGLEMFFSFLISNIILYLILVPIYNAGIILPRGITSMGVRGRMYFLDKNHALSTIKKIFSSLDKNEQDKLNKINEIEPDVEFDHLSGINLLSEYIFTLRFYVKKRAMWDLLILPIVPLDRTPRKTFMDSYLKNVLFEDTKSKSWFSRSTQKNPVKSTNTINPKVNSDNPLTILHKNGNLTTETPK